MDLPPAQTEDEYLRRTAQIASRNKVFKSYIGQGYYDTIVPGSSGEIYWRPGMYTSIRLTGRNCAGAAGSIAEFPDHGDGPHGDGNCQCFPAGREYGGRRSNGDAICIAYQ
nr:hypothetical protein [Anseongella ginsenosidimutans]